MNREEAIKELQESHDMMRSYDIDSSESRLMTALNMAIKALEQEPKTGHWEWLTENKYRCSNCNHETRVDECMNEPMYDFCPFCRARMESEE